MGTRGYSEFPAYGRFLLRLAYGNLKQSVTSLPSEWKAGYAFAQPPHVAMRIGLYHRHSCDVWRAVSEGSDLFRDRPSLRIVRSLRLLLRMQYASILGCSRI